MSETAIAIRGLTKAFGRYAVLRGIDLDLRAGEVTVLIGGERRGKIDAGQGLVRCSPGRCG